jgi:hypothetical protein
MSEQIAVVSCFEETSTGKYSMNDTNIFLDLLCTWKRDGLKIKWPHNEMVTCVRLHEHF